MRLLKFLLRELKEVASSLKDEGAFAPVQVHWNFDDGWDGWFHIHVMCFENGEYLLSLFAIGYECRGLAWDFLFLRHFIQQLHGYE